MHSSGYIVSLATCCHFPHLAAPPRPLLPNSEPLVSPRLILLTFEPGQKLSLILIKKLFVVAAGAGPGCWSWLWAAGKKRLIGQGNTHYKQSSGGKREMFMKNENENKVNTS